MNSDSVATVAEQLVARHVLVRFLRPQEQPSGRLKEGQHASMILNVTFIFNNVGRNRGELRLQDDNGKEVACTTVDRDSVRDA